MSTSEKIPDPRDGESPTAYADRAGQWYAGKVDQDHRKVQGQYLTPVGVAEFMAGLLCRRTGTVRLIDPGAGAGILTCALCQHLLGRKNRPSQLIIEAWENDPDFFSVLEKVMSFLQTSLEASGVPVSFNLRKDDFVLEYAHVLSGSNTLFDSDADTPSFDIAISNPPYFKIPKSDLRARVSGPIVHGQPNIYALFMAIAAGLLAPKGQFVFITPRSFSSGPYFRRFRDRFFAMMKPELIHVFESRTDAFKRDGILQENIIIKARKAVGWSANGSTGKVVISSSNGGNDLLGPTKRLVPTSSVVDMKTQQKFLRIPLTDKQDEVVAVVDSWPCSLKSLGLQISTGPVVAFRALDVLWGAKQDGVKYAPLLWMQNVRAMTIEWPIKTRNKLQYIKANDRSAPLLLPDKTYVLLRRFSTKEEHRRLIAAPLIAGRLRSRLIGLENHLNYIHRPGGCITNDEAWGLAVLYNSKLLDTYFRTLNGNTQVSATELRSIPLPAHDVILEIGRRAKSARRLLDSIDSLAEAACEQRLVQ